MLSWILKTDMDPPTKNARRMSLHLFVLCDSVLIAESLLQGMCPLTRREVSASSDWGQSCLGARVAGAEQGLCGVCDSRLPESIGRGLQLAFSDTARPELQPGAGHLR